MFKSIAFLLFVFVYSYARLCLATSGGTKPGLRRWAAVVNSTPSLPASKDLIDSSSSSSYFARSPLLRATCISLSFFAMLVAVRCPDRAPYSADALFSFASSTWLASVPDDINSEPANAILSSLRIIKWTILL